MGSATTSSLVMLLACLALPVATLAQSAPPCPASLYQAAWGDSIPFTGPTLVFSIPDAAGRERSGSFDLPSGRLASRLGMGNVGWTFVRAVDRFDVTGVPAGTAVPLVAALDVDGYSETSCIGPSCGGWFGAHLYGAGVVVEQQVTAHGSPTGRTDLVTTLTLPVTIVAGTGLVLGFELYEFVAAGVTGGGGGSGTIRFIGVPAGANVVSCESYSLATPTRSASWGSLKTLYR